MPKKDDRLIVYEKMYKEMFYSKNLLEKFPKHEKFGLCTDIKNEESNMLRLILMAWKEKDNKERYKYLKNADIENYVLKTFIRIAFMSKYITAQNFKAWNEQLTEIGKMIGGWMKTCQKE